MHPAVFREFQSICRARFRGGSVLEIGAIPSELSLLRLPALECAALKIGVDLNGPFRCGDYRIVPANANRLPFPDSTFDLILCNSVLEHDRRFWETVAEMKRTAKPAGLIAIGVPGFTEVTLAKRAPLFRLLRLLGKFTPTFLDAALTLQVHNYPGDYYRFSPRAFEEEILAGLEDVEIRTLLCPPRVIGFGRLPDAALSALSGKPRRKRPGNAP